jgi:hypothetical protein
MIPKTQGLIYATLKLNQLEMRRLRRAVGRCELCGADGTVSFFDPLVMDHDHSTGLTRGIVCRSCNRAIDLVERRRPCRYPPPGLAAWLQRGLLAA